MKKILMVLLCVLCLSGCKGLDNTADDSIKKEEIVVKDILEYKNCFTKTAEELGLNAEDFYIRVNGDAYGYKARASLFFNYNENNVKDGLSDIIIYLDNTDLMEMFDRFSVLYHGAVSAGMEPYVESNGGAVTWYVFADETAEYRLSSASKRNYLTVTVTPNENPENDYDLMLEKHFDLSSLFPKEYKTKLISFEDGILSFSLLNNSDEMCDLSEYRLFEEIDNDYYGSMTSLNYGMINVSEINIDKGEEKVIEINLREYGKLQDKKYMLEFNDFNLYFSLCVKD